MTDDVDATEDQARHDDGVDQQAWVERVVRAILADSARMMPNRPPNVSARLIAYYATRPERIFELELYEERAAEAGAGGAPARVKH